MMRKTQKLGALLVPLLSIGINTMAQTKLLVATKNATEISYDLNTVRAMYFAKDSLQIKTTNTVQKVYALNAVQKVYFRQNIITGASESFVESKGALAWLWPNPADNEITFGLRESEAQVSLYDQSGRFVLQQYINALQMNLDITQLSQGLYLAKVSTPSQSQTISFLKK